MAITEDLDIAGQLRAWARGMYTSEAAVELLLRAYGGRFGRPGWDWIVIDDGRLWFDVDRLTDDAMAGLSGGERRLLDVVAALLQTRRLDLGDVTAGLDRASLSLVLAAIAHAGGSHEHSDVVIDTKAGTYRTAVLPSLYPWPPTTGGADDDGATE